MLRLIDRLEVDTGHGYRVNALVLRQMEDWIERGVVTGYVCVCTYIYVLLYATTWYCLYDEMARLSRFTLVNFNSVLAYAESTL